MIKTLQNAIKIDKEKYRVPGKVQDVIPVGTVWPDGIWKCGNRFTKTFMFSDINFSVASEEDKEMMFQQYAALLNSLDSAATTKITISNRSLSEANFESELLMELKGDDRDKYRIEFNKILLSKATEANGVIQEKFITVSYPCKDIGEARSYFNRIGAGLVSRFAALGSICMPLNTEEKMRMLHSFYRPDEEGNFHFDLENMMRHGNSFKDYICPDGMERHKDYLVIGNRFVRTFFIKDYASFVTDNFVEEITDLCKNMLFSIDIIPIPTAEAVKDMENRLLGVETNITNWQRRQNSNYNFSADIPYDMELQRAETREFLDDLVKKDQHMMFGLITIALTADSKDELESETKALKSVAEGRGMQIATLTFQQTDALNTALPIGERKINAMRTFNTQSLGIFLPFKVQEIQDRGGIYIGQNAISHNLLMVNREKLLNQSAIVLGISGSGKSLCVKNMIAQILLNTDDDVLICDPEGEYGPLVTALSPDDSSVIHVAAGGRDRLNAMYMVDGYGEGDPIVIKSQFIMSLIGQIDKNGVDAHKKSVIDRCVDAIYRNAYVTGETPTLSTLREELLKQPEQDAKDVALSLELYTKGSLNIFGGEGNVDLEKRALVFDIHGLGKDLKPAGLLVITDTMLNRVTLNWRKGKRTHVFIDEFHVVYENEFSAEFFSSAWRQFRKRNAFPTAITQNVEYLLESVQASTMISNSEFIIMLNQNGRDREKLGKLLSISKEQMNHITNARAGSGLIKYGGAMVPFMNDFPKNTELYKLMTTKPGEGVFSS